MTAKPATVRSVMRIYYRGPRFNWRHVSRNGAVWLEWIDIRGIRRTEFRPYNSAPVEFVRWPEKTK